MFFFFAATFVHLQQVYFICNSFLICSMSPVGYRMFPIFLSSDRNECEDGSAKCPANAFCSNTAGSYSCRCAEGYTLNEQGLCAGESERTECQQHSAFLRKMEKFFKESGTSNLHFRIHNLFCYCTFVFN